jgi:hypothetical protein
VRRSRRGEYALIKWVKKDWYVFLS